MQIFVHNPREKIFTIFVTLKDQDFNVNQVSHPKTTKKSRANERIYRRTIISLLSSFAFNITNYSFLKTAS